MLIQESPNNWSCLPTAFATVVGRPVKEIINYIGHDGSEIIWSTLPEPQRRRSFHIQEMYMYCLSINYSVTTLSPNMGTCPDNDNTLVKPYVFANRRFLDMINYYYGVITGITEQGERHAVAWDGKDIVDKLIIPEAYIENFHIVTRIV